MHANADMDANVNVDDPGSYHLELTYIYGQYPCHPLKLRVQFPTMASTVDTVLAVEKTAVNHVEDTLGHGAVSEARQATDDEHSQTLLQALRDNRKAVMWSVLVSVTIIMEGYDTILMANFFAYPTFQQKYGQDYGGDIGWQVSAPWQTGLSMASTVGCIFGESTSSVDYSPRTRLT